jgi:hypothetical protein
MLTLAWDNGVTLAAALLIGLVTARWAFPRRAAAAERETGDEAKP